MSPEVSECWVASHLVLLADTLGLGAVQLGNLHLGVGLELLGQLVPDRDQLLTVTTPGKDNFVSEILMSGSEDLPGSVELDEGVSRGDSSSKTSLGENM